ncbi:MAG: cupin domain-containing protein [Actinomycetota bacterium]|nr:cupin domain-containing protein [Actinomycetota bacterium]
MRLPQAGELAWNPVTGERGIVLEGPEENADQRLVVELHVSPGGAVVGEHLHPAITERFEVLEGRLGVKLSGRGSEAATGDAVEIPPGSWHDWWNAGETDAVVRVTVTPGKRFSELISTLFGLALDGRTNSKGMPAPLQLVQVAREFDDVIVLRRPPRILQRALFGLLAPIARRRGYRGTYPRYETAEIVGSPEDVRGGKSLDVRFGDGPGPP